jgi:predicted TIM-barrel fold metal-dependent hydrolase
MIVDVNMHWSPEDLYKDQSFMNQYLRCIPRAYGEHVEIREKPGTNIKELIISRPKGYENLSSDFIYHHGSEDRIRAMDKTGVDKGVLRWPISPEWLTLEICKRANDAMAKTVREHPDRFLGLAIVPPWGDKDCLKELDRCINDLGCFGVDIAAHYGTLYLDAEELRPFFRKVNELNVPLIVHHTNLPVDYGHIYDYTNLRRLFGRCIDQMTSVGRILYSGMLEELPNLKFIHTMMAGGLFAFADLITPRKSTVPGDRERFDPAASERVRGYLKRNIFLDITHAPPWGKAQLECAVKVLGAENILFGSSYPLRSEWLYKGVEYVKDLAISEKEKELVLGGNAARLFKIKA